MKEKRYFGTDGIRGRVGAEPITAEFMLKVGHALGRVLAATESQPDSHPAVLIGKDTRVSGYMFESALEAGLVSAGANVMLLGPMPTPAVAWLTRELAASAGLVISASHNPYFDNGIKFFNRFGEKLSDDIELEIEQTLREPMQTAASEQLGKATRVANAQSRYLEFCAASVSGLSLRGKRIVLDCAHGATYQIAPRVFSELGAEVIALGVQPDGFNINAGCGATDLAMLRAATVQHGADFGIAFDGDGDRVQLIDANGGIADGDDIVYLLAKDMHLRGELCGPVVGTQMTNYGVQLAIEKLGVAFMRARVGDRHVLQMLREHGGVLGGEASGHVLRLDRSTTGDGILIALFVLDALQRMRTTLFAVRNEVRRLPQITVNVPAVGGSSLVANGDVQRAFGDVQNTLSGRGRVVLRPSGTEPLVRVTVEGEDEAEVRGLAHSLARAVESAAEKFG